MELQTIQWEEIVTLQTVAYVFGLLMLFCGVRLYRLVLMMPGALLLGIMAAEWSQGFPAEFQLGSVVLAGIVGGICMLGIEQFAISLLGAVGGGGFVFFLSPLLCPLEQVSWEWLTFGVILGAICLPLVFSKSLSLVTSAIGAMSLCWASNQREHLFLLIALTVLGWGIQLYFLRKKRHYD